MPAIPLLTGVDIYVGGHVHDYERMYDMYRGQSAGRTLDMRATTYITTGMIERRTAHRTPHKNLSVALWLLR